MVGVVVPPPRPRAAQQSPHLPAPSTPEKEKAKSAGQASMQKPGDGQRVQASPGPHTSPPLKKTRLGGVEGTVHRHASGAEVLVTNDGRVRMMPKPKEVVCMEQARPAEAAQAGVAPKPTVPGPSPGVAQTMPERGPGVATPQQTGPGPMPEQAVPQQMGLGRMPQQTVPQQTGPGPMPQQTGAVPQQFGPGPARAVPQPQMGTGLPEQMGPGPVLRPVQMPASRWALEWHRWLMSPGLAQMAQQHMGPGLVQMPQQMGPGVAMPQHTGPGVAQMLPQHMGPGVPHIVQMPAQMIPGSPLRPYVGGGSPGTSPTPMMGTAALQGAVPPLPRGGAVFAGPLPMPMRCSQVLTPPATLPVQTSPPMPTLVQQPQGMMPPSTSAAGEAAGAAIDMAFASLQVLTGDAGLSPALTEKFTQLIEECARHRAAADAEGQLRAQQNQSASEQPGGPSTEQAAQQNKSASAQPRPSTEPPQQGQVAEAQQSQEAEDHGRNQAATAKMDEKAGQSAQPRREGEGEVQSITTTSPSPSPEKEANDTSHRNGGTAVNAASLEKINSQTHPEVSARFAFGIVVSYVSRKKRSIIRKALVKNECSDAQLMFMMYGIEIGTAEIAALSAFFLMGL
ncbi:unnamed protein product [Symbiodinium sp. KB8]|nr:unnamed protein product [Symbiodinium sp. KB8]